MSDQIQLSSADKAVQRESGWRLTPGTVSFRRENMLHQVQLDGDDGYTSAVSMAGVLQTGTRVMCLVLPEGLIYIAGVTSPMAAPLGTLDAVDVLTAGNIVTSVTVETLLSSLSLSAVFVAGQTYAVDFQAFATVSATADDWQINCREDDISGTQIGAYPFSGFNTVGTLRGTFFYRPLVSGQRTIVFTVAPRSVTGNVSILGGPGSDVSRTWSSVGLASATRIV